MGASIVFSLALLLITLFSDDLWEEHDYEHAPPIVAGIPAPHMDGREKMACSSCHVIMSTRNQAALPSTNPNATGIAVPPIKAGTLSPHTDGREAQPCRNCHQIIPRSAAQAQQGMRIGQATPPSRPQPVGVAAAWTQQPQRQAMASNALQPVMPPDGVKRLRIAGPGQGNGTTDFGSLNIPLDRAGLHRFQGSIAQVAISAPNAQNSLINIWVDDGVNVPHRAVLAPSWFLEEQRCPVSLNMYVKGLAFRIELPQAVDPLYVKTIAVNGKTCVLRDTLGAPAWQ
ncbi:magnetochrome domain-containing protein [Magnetospira sp. QH-2]|uniref:magnetochrome domain-containing protein n=1 Tax=Magnetospira sp. (strain QH-2) TaxID=1288970 RepID=UPI00130DF0E6|nr:magnetochrome domain-containing protein [Magnetospira sp. QH-2]